MHSGMLVLSSFNNCLFVGASSEMSAHEVIMYTLMELSITDVGATSPPGPSAACGQDGAPAA